MAWAFASVSEKFPSTFKISKPSSNHGSVSEISMYVPELNETKNKPIAVAQAQPNICAAS